MGKINPEKLYYGRECRHIIFIIIFVFMSYLLLVLILPCALWSARVSFYALQHAQGLGWCPCSALRRREQK
jgi:hypothetical protein